MILIFIISVLLKLIFVSKAHWSYVARKELSTHGNNEILIVLAVLWHLASLDVRNTSYSSLCQFLKYFTMLGCGLSLPHSQWGYAIAGWCGAVVDEQLQWVPACITGQFHHPRECVLPVWPSIFDDGMLGPSKVQNPGKSQKCQCGRCCMSLLEIQEPIALGNVILPKWYFMNRSLSL